MLREFKEGTVVDCDHIVACYAVEHKISVEKACSVVIDYLMESYDWDLDRMHKIHMKLMEEDIYNMLDSYEADIMNVYTDEITNGVTIEGFYKEKQVKATYLSKLASILKRVDTYSYKSTVNMLAREAYGYIVE